MELKEFIDKMERPMERIKLVSKLIELEAIDNWLNAMYGINLDIKVKLVEKTGGRWYGKGIVEKM